MGHGKPDGPHSTTELLGLHDGQPVVPTLLLQESKMEGLKLRPPPILVSHGTITGTVMFPATFTTPLCPGE